MNTWNEPGKGRKQCPKCKLYIPARAAKCVCEGGGGEAKPEKKEITVWNEGGKGRKPCPGCGKYVPVRTASCPCGHEFEKKEPVASSAPTAPAVAATPQPKRHESQALLNRRRYGAGCRVVDTPAGKCPVGKLDSTNEHEVELWANEVLGWGEKNQTIFTTRAICYFVRESYNVNSLEYKKVAAILHGLGLDHMDVEEDDQEEDDQEDE